MSALAPAGSPPILTPSPHPPGRPSHPACTPRLRRFTYHLAKLLAPTPAVVNAVTPGFVPVTALGRDVTTGNALARFAMMRLAPLLPFAVSLEEGTRRIAAVCVGEAEGRLTGCYYSRGVETVSSEASRDAALAEELWRLSCADAGLEGVPYVPEGCTSSAGAAGTALAEAVKA
jgi:hypothetical protein